VKGRTISQTGKGLLFGAVCALMVWAIGAWGWLLNLERSTLDTLFTTRGVLYPSSHIVVLQADDRTIDRFHRWPLPRKVYADLVNHLTSAGAKTIAFDVLLTVPSDRPADDALLTQATTSSKRVLHATAFNLEAQDDPIVPPGFHKKIPELLTRFRATDAGAKCMSSLWGSSPLPALQDGAAGVGHVNVPPERDGVRRRIPHLVRLLRGKHAELYPSLSLAAAVHFWGLKPRDIITDANSISLRLPNGERREIPVDDEGRTWINWIGGNNSFVTHSFQDVLDGLVPDEIFKDKIVLIGITAAGAFEQQATPFSSVQPAVEIQANALDDILMNRPLYALPSSIWLALIIVLPMIVGVIAMRRDARASAVLTGGLCLALWFAALICLSHFNLVLPVAVPILAAALTWSLSVGYRQANQARYLKQAEERYALAVDGANDGIWDWDLHNGTIYYSPRWKSILGHPHADVGNSIDEWYSRIHPDDFEQMQAHLQAHLSGSIEHFESRHRMRHRDGSWIWVLARGLRICGKQGQPSRMAGSLGDITVQVAAQEQLEHNAFYDTLTGLPNRALFMDVLARAMARTRRRVDYSFAVLFLDLDRFKMVNDSLGHALGDELLLGVARRLESCLRPGDTAARLGGDEFTLLLDDIADVSVATRVAERIQSELSLPFNLNGHEVYHTSSIGIAVSSLHYRVPEELLRDADTAMYRAKALGRARHAIFDEAMHAHVLSVLRMETDLRRALERNDFQVYYQPIVALASGKITGFEALVRWNHPERGMVSPAEFIPLSEETGLIIPLDRLVLREACDQLRIWQSEFPHLTLSISVNLSTKQFSQPDMPEQIQQILKEVGLAPTSLKLEITESLLMNNPENAAEMLHVLREMGIRLSIDDFGTGYSSLSYLHRFPLDALKIDQSFINRMGPDGENSEIVSTIVTLARNLNMDVIAEGIETPIQAQQLNDIKCDFGQGYFFSKALDAMAARQLLMTGGHWNES
jgi:diguanylate cyclase (GGDEF)-like protein/PAS domain S-box-containing protein